MGIDCDSSAILWTVCSSPSGSGRWGDQVEEGTPLVAVETDKVTAEIPAPVSGRLVERLAGIDDEVDVGSQFCVIEE
jgi:pyruvate/2-oxoglutarate dehydrogenase complex dihydrolipoamide acyltransferase (E2) component